MDLLLRATGGPEERENQSSLHGQRSNHRHTSEQISRLEFIFNECPHPDGQQRQQIALELGLTQRQIKFWFQNKRTQKKTLQDREENHALRVENARIYNENMKLKEALKSSYCRGCGGSSYLNEEPQQSLEQIKLENARLREEHEKVAKLLAKHMKKQVSQQAPPIGTSFDMSLASPLNSSTVESPSLDLSLSLGSPSSSSNENIFPKLAISAKEELLRLMGSNEPFWVKSPTTPQRLALHSETYKKFFPKANHLSATARVESSKDSRIVRLNAMQLVDMILDSDKWANIFSTMITKAQTIEVIESGLSQNRSGALLLMYEEMHTLSPLVPAREFCFLRYCQHVEAGIWVIADVSIDFPKRDTSSSRSWKLPSGWIIHKITNESSWVTCVEHVEVEDLVPIHRLYKDLVNRNIAYGAERWLMELHRMCERFIKGATGSIIGNNSKEGSKSLMRLSQRMVKSLCGILNMPSELDFPQNLDGKNHSRVRISILKSTEAGHPNGTIVVASTSFWLPLPSQTILSFLNDSKNRPKWDALCYGTQAYGIHYLSSGSHPDNYISIIRLVNPSTDDVLIIQESITNPFGSYVIYAPINIKDFEMVINGGDSSMVAILPSGVTISEEGQSCVNVGASTSANGGRARGSLLTIAFQILMSSPSAVNMESVNVINRLITSTVKNIGIGLSGSSSK